MNTLVFCFLCSIGAATYGWWCKQKSFLYNPVEDSEHLNLLIKGLDTCISQRSSFELYLVAMKEIVNRTNDASRLLQSVKLPNPVEKQTIDILNQVFVRKLSNSNEKILKI